MYDVCMYVYIYIHCIYYVYIHNMYIYNMYIYYSIIYKSHFGAISSDGDCFGDVPFLGAL